MANATVNLPITFTNYVRADAPYAVYKINNSKEYQINYIRVNGEIYLAAMLGKVAKMPNNLRHNILVGYQYVVAAKNTSQLYMVAKLDRIQDYDENTVNYNSRHTGDSLNGFRVEGQTAFQNYTVSQNTYAKVAYELLSLGAVLFQSTDQSSEGGLFSKAFLANGSTRPYIAIIYDDTAKIKSKVSYNSSQLTGTISNAVAKTLTWDLIRDTSTYASSYCADPTWNQASAVFKYRKAGESTWITRNVSGSTKSITIPAGTFQSGASYEYQITVTDEDGTVSSTSVYTFATAATKVTPSNAPTSGYANPRNPISFGWVYQSTAGGTIASGATTLHWRVSGDETWNDVQAAAGVNSLTIPANTFPTASTIQWYLSGSDSTGYASQTSIYSFSTAAGLVRATAISPSNTIESNNQPITFKWSYSSPDGFEPTRYLFLWKLVTDESYTTLRDSTDIVDEYTFPAYTFPAGEIKWCVNAYNIDGVKDVGYVKTFISYGAPAAPVVYAEAVPFATVEWQSDDQQAYQIKVDDVIYGPYFGTEKIFSIPDKLEDGEHTIGVSVVGTYGLWSEWGTATVTVQNVPGEEIVLGGVPGVDNFLSWTTAEETSDFLIFRDGVQIGRTAEISFTDRFAAGEHTYKVINRLSDGNYSESNEVTLDANIDGTYISLLSGGEWLKIKYMLKSASDQEYEESVETVYNHLAGDYYPSISISNYYERSLKYSAVFLFTEEADHAKFKAMLKRPVVMKFENGNIIAGVIDSWTVLHKKHYYTAYTFSLRQIEWEDYVDDTT